MRFLLALVAGLVGAVTVSAPIPESRRLKLTYTLPHVLKRNADWILSVAFSPNGSTLASGIFDKTITLWDVRTGNATATLRGHSDLVYFVDFSPNSRTLASGNMDGTIILWDVKAGTKELVR